MPNRVRVDSEGFLRQTYVGDQTEQSMLETIARLNVLAGDLKVKNQKVLGLVDLSELGEMGPRVRKIATEAARNIPYDKAALYAPSIFNKALVNLVLLAAGKSRTIRIFTTEKEAIAWLKGKTND